MSPSLYEPNPTKPIELLVPFGFQELKVLSSYLENRTVDQEYTPIIVPYNKNANILQLEKNVQEYILRFCNPNYQNGVNLRIVRYESLPKSFEQTEFKIEHLIRQPSFNFQDYDNTQIYWINVEKYYQVTTLTEICDIIIFRYAETLLNSASEYSITEYVKTREGILSNSPFYDKRGLQWFQAKIFSNFLNYLITQKITTLQAIAGTKLISIYTARNYCKNESWTTMTDATAVKMWEALKVLKCFD